ncbi:MAG: hypothetical protein IPO81_28790 [Kouleothrix sp.]|nr:hypothetical protein [Kouleothrix sp.]
MGSFYVIGGQQRAPRPLRAGNRNWNGYERGVIMRVDPETHDIKTCVTYVSPPEVCAADDPAITLQASTIQDSMLYTCTQTEVLIYALPSFERLGYLSLPCFNDVHHVRPTPEGNLLVANAGLEMVVETTPAGELRRVWNVLGEDPWGRFSREVDYRRIETKPHRAHPNYVFTVGDEIWATRFHQGDAICLTSPEKRIQISSERIHDGVLHDGRLYFTVVSGSIVVANPQTLQVEQVINLNSMHAEGTLLGWCRGIFIDGDKLWVGFSRIRPTKFRENVSWVMHGFKHVLPTRVACYDLSRRRCVVEIDLEPTGLGAVYSVLPTLD